MKKLQLLFLFLILIFLSACSTVNTTNNNTPAENEVYVFDDASDLQEEIEEVKEEKTVVESGEIVYIVQVGAFTTKARAERFTRENTSDVNHEMSISYSQKVGLFVVQLPEFNSKSEAETVRNQLWKNKTFSDAFIIIKKK